MKLITFIPSPTPKDTPRPMGPHAKGRVGLWAQDGTGKDIIIDYGASLNAVGSSVAPPRDMIELIERGDAGLDLAEKMITSARQGQLPANCLVAPEQATLLSPIPRPTSVRDGYAFRQHVEAARRNRGVPMIPEFDHFPIFYFTNALAITGPGPVLVHPRALEKLDFELEAAIVVGKEGRNLSAKEADTHIYGYMIMNDWSARALQMEEMKLNLGPAKGKDFATSLGPYLVPRRSLANKSIPGDKGERHDLPMKTWVNGKLLSEGNLKDISWTFAQILERVSEGITVYPGEVIGSGTVGTGCLLELNGSKITDNLWIKDGDEVVMEIGELGRLENKVIKTP